MPLRAARCLSLALGTATLLISLCTGSRYHNAVPSLDDTPAYTDEQKLLYHLLRQYEKAVRPVRNASHTITVKLGMTMTNIFDMDEKNQVLTINVWLDQEWKDELLRWDPKEFGGIESIRIPCDLIWLPDIVLYNNADDYTEGYMRSRAMVFFDGTVFWPPPTQLRSTCKIDVTYFPFDSQRCSLKFGSWTYHGFQVDITNRSDNVDLSNYVVSGEFELVRVHQKRRVVKYTCCPEPYPDVTFFIHIRRKTLYYLYNVVFPCMMMSVLTLLVFFLPPDSGEKIALGITVLLAFSVFVLAIAEKMPETSDSMPLIGIYLTVVMSMTSVSVVMTVMVLNFHHRGPFNKPVPDWVRVFILEKLRRILFMKLPYTGYGDSVTSAISATGLMQKMSLRLAIDDMLGNEIFGNSDVGGPPSNDSTVTYGNNHTNHVGNNHYMALSNNNYQPPEEDLLNHQLIDETSLDGQGKTAQQRKKKRRSKEMNTKLFKTLEMLIRRQEIEDQCNALANEWRQVAQVIDRLLFWVFLVATVFITLLLLIIIPTVHRAMESDEFDESQFGNH
uniref:Neur_chan_LBD domain-containing protein n=1 Tax=Steinernema glaseri TaxID=37863 RepID=A0A1I8AR31_9BILA